MIYVNGKLWKAHRFPDGTLAPKQEIWLSSEPEENIFWFYDSDLEMSEIFFLKKYLDTRTNQPIYLHLHYIPNARMDRVEPLDLDAWFTLRYFCDFINSLNFSGVSVLDAHSNVALALIDNVQSMNSSVYIDDVLFELEQELGITPLIFYPDEGSYKRYSQLISLPCAFGMKTHDWASGKILDFKIINEELVKGHDILIIDDICSKGGTFYHAAKALKAAGAKSVYLWVTHCEDTIHDGELLKDNGLIERVYTTNSILRKPHDKITIERLQTI